MPVLSYRCTKILNNQLPDLQPKAATPGDPALRQLATEVHNLAENARLDREDRKTFREEQAKPKTVRQAYKDRLADKLLKLTASATDTTSPICITIWHRSQKAGRQATIIQVGLSSLHATNWLLEAPLGFPWYYCLEPLQGYYYSSAGCSNFLLASFSSRGIWKAGYYHPSWAI